MYPSAAHDYNSQMQIDINCSEALVSNDTTSGITQHEARQSTCDMVFHEASLKMQLAIIAFTIYALLVSLFSFSLVWKMHILYSWSLLAAVTDLDGSAFPLLFLQLSSSMLEGRCRWKISPPSVFAVDAMRSSSLQELAWPEHWSLPCCVWSLHLHINVHTNGVTGRTLHTSRIYTLLPPTYFQWGLQFWWWVSTPLCSDCMQELFA